MSTHQPDNNLVITSKVLRKLDVLSNRGAFTYKSYKIGRAAADVWRVWTLEDKVATIHYHDYRIDAIKELLELLGEK